MTNNNIRAGHKISAGSSNKVTVRLTSTIAELQSWAKQEGVAEAFDIVAQAFGQSEAFTVIGNLSQELSHPESSVTLNDWVDNPIVNMLLKLHAAYQSSSHISSQHPPLSHSGNSSSTANMLRSMGADIAKRHFLLYLITNPLSGGCSEHAYLLRRKLRLWLIIQALIRTAHHQCPHDANIQKVAGYITKDIHDANWEVVDAVLDRTEQLLPRTSSPYQYFSIALEQAAREVKQRDSGPGPARFLNATIDITRGHCSPVKPESDTPAELTSFSQLRTQQRPPPFLHSNNKAYEEIELPSENTASDDDDQPIIVYDVDPAATPAQQRLTGQSILIQNTELSHYLPWSWDRALPPEINALENWIQKGLASPEEEQQFGAANVWLATHLSRSLAFLMEVTISDSPSAEWTLSTDFSSIQRQPPRRHNAWLPKSTAEQTSVARFVDILSAKLPLPIQTALRSAFIKAEKQASDLHGLWRGVIPEKPESWFSEQARKHFPRLSSGKLANVQSQKTFELTADHSLARLISAHPRTALPAACGYSNWDIEKVESGFGLSLDTQTNERQQHASLLGSLLVPLESLLVEQIRRATEALNASPIEDTIYYHNTLTHYTVMALYAATGSRYLSDPFESASHFCSSLPSVFINDKTDGGLHSGRLVPLPNRAVSIVKAYKKHLVHLADAAEPVRPDLAQNIRGLSSGKSTELPLFFLLDSHCRWHSVTDQELPGNTLFEWSLPPNLFRHRYAQQLALAGVDAEVIEGWMGHAERGAASYGDASPRCWADDFDKFQSSVNTVFDRLGFEVPSSVDRLPEIQRPTSKHSSYREPSRFGQSRRADNRRIAIKRAINDAKKDLNFLAGNKPIDELETDQIQQIVNLMILRENGLPHPQAAIRLSVFTKQLEASENPERRHVRKRMAMINNERSLVSVHCPRAMDLMPDLMTWSSQIKREILKSKLSKFESLAIATMCLAIDKRLTYARLLNDVIQGKNYRLIQHKKLIFFEYSEHLDEDPDNFFIPVQRHQIDYKTASLLSHGRSVKTTIDLCKANYTKRLHPLANVLQRFHPNKEPGTNTATLGWLLPELQRVISQANLIQLPGVVAGALSERRPPTSLYIYDYLRLREGVRFQLPTPMADTTPFRGVKPFLAPVSSKDPANNEQLFQNAKAFFQGMRQLLDSYNKPTAKQTAKNLETFCQEKMTAVSPAILLVGYWLVHLIRAGKGRKATRHNPYAASSPHRYLSALAETFRGLAFNVDLTELDEDEATELCSDMLTFTRTKQTDVAYFAARLQEFFRWAGEQGIAEPLWDDLDLGDSSRTVKPGIFTECEYLKALELIQERPSEHPDHPLLISFVLLLGFRFGLRASEAIGLMRQDWCESGNLVWILVRNNKYRALKRPSSRRAIPLLFELTDAEQQLVDSVLGRYEAIAARKKNLPILCQVVNGKPTIAPLRSVIPSAIASVLKEVTGSPKTSLHDARHSFYNRLAPLLEGYGTPATNNLNANIDTDSVRKLILGSQSARSRRATMALARAMGHSTPHTGIRSYDHLMTDWADTLTPVTSSRTHRLRNATNTANWAVQKPLPPSSDKPLLCRNMPTPETTVAALRLMSLGYNTERIETRMRLEPGSTDLLDKLVERTNHKLRFRVLDAETEKPVWIYGAEKPRLLLKKINDGAWTRFIEQAQNFAKTDDLDLENSLPCASEMPDLVGRNGHILVANPDECQLVKLMLETFQIPEAQYRIIARADDPDTTELLTDYGWKVSPSAGHQLDSHQVGFKSAKYRGASSGGLIFNQAAVGCVRNRYELVLALLITAAAYCPP